MTVVVTTPNLVEFSVSSVNFLGGLHDDLPELVVFFIASVPVAVTTPDLVVFPVSFVTSVATTPIFVTSVTYFPWTSATVQYCSEVLLESESLRPQRLRKFNQLRGGHHGAPLLRSRRPQRLREIQPRSRRSRKI
jgi:hypothetical protein